jgi:hypothetical protein
VAVEATPGCQDGGVAGTGILQRGAFIVCSVCFAKLLPKAVDCLLTEPHRGFSKAVEAFFADLMVCMGYLVRRRFKPTLRISRGSLLSIINHVPFAASYASFLVKPTDWTMGVPGTRFARTSCNL